MVFGDFAGFPQLDDLEGAFFRDGSPPAEFEEFPHGFEFEGVSAVHADGGHVVLAEPDAFGVWGGELEEALDHLLARVGLVVVVGELEGEDVTEPGVGDFGSTRAAVGGLQVKEGGLGALDGRLGGDVHFDVLLVVDHFEEDGLAFEVVGRHGRALHRASRCRYT